MSVAVFLKNNLNGISPRVGKIINHLPYSMRPGLGSIYKQRQREIDSFERYSFRDKQQFVFERLKSIISYAYSHIHFYREYYTERGFNPNMLKNFEDIPLVPIVNKSILREYDIDQRSRSTPGRYIVNTGGSSGEPFSLYVEPSSMGHEWAHIHQIWSKLEYCPSDFKLVFAGRSNIKDLVEYDVVRNHFMVDIYTDFRDVANKLKPILGKYNIKYLHGYPSSIYDFALYCANEDGELQSRLSKSLKGAFLGSEFPHPHYREVIEEVFDIPTISWYGHTERCVLAYEKTEKFKYEPFGTYGFAEVAESQNTGNHHLIATSYYNRASPLIRYNTEDIISDIELENNLLKSFKISEGREGEYILDKAKKKINLTGLIFGRHHKLFNYAKFIQVKQPSLGKIEIHFVADRVDQSRARDLFDSTNLNLHIEFIKRSEPVRTLSGKINLLIKDA